MNLAHFHPLLVHFPIGIWLISALLYFTNKKGWIPTLPTTFIALMGVGTLFAVLSAITGIWHMLQSDISPLVIIYHIAGAVISIILSFFILKLHKKANKPIAFNIAYTLLIVSTIATGHFGGSITHGGGYLFQFPENNIERKTIGNTHYVEIIGMKYSPSELIISKGDSVIFINKDLVPHDVVNDINNIHLSPKISTTKKWGTTFFEKTNYHCSFHPSMKGVIRIE